MPFVSSLIRSTAPRHIRSRRPEQVSAAPAHGMIRSAPSPTTTTFDPGFTLAASAANQPRAHPRSSTSSAPELRAAHLKLALASHPPGVRASRLMYRPKGRRRSRQPIRSPWITIRATGSRTCAGKNVHTGRERITDEAQHRYLAGGHTGRRSQRKSSLVRRQHASWRVPGFLLNT